MVDLTKYSVPMLLSANKNSSYRAGVIEGSTALLVFLKRNGLINLDPLDEGGDLKLDFVLRESNLTPEGLELFRSAVPRWHKAQDRGKPYGDISILEKELDKIKNKFDGVT